MKNLLKSFIYLSILTILLTSLVACGGTSIDDPDEVDWQTAIENIHSGQITEVMQSHNLQVMLTLKDGSQIKTVEPSIDEIFHEVNLCGNLCSEIILITE